MEDLSGIKINMKS